jgi:putative ABC transport system permease protein
MTVLALLTGILGAVTLGALAGARRTDTAYDRYLTAINASDVFVDVPGALKTIGLTRGQVRAVVAWQTTLTLLIAVVVGGPLGVVGGRLAWRAFAGSLGVVPIVEVPLAVIVLGLAALVLVGNLLAELPAAVAARTRPGVELRTE